MDNFKERCPCVRAGEIRFGEMMNMFRDDLLDLNAILDYIKMPPAEESVASTSSTVCSAYSSTLCLLSVSHTGKTMK